MAALHDLLTPLMAAAHRDLSRPEKTLSSEDVAGVAVLLGLSGELLSGCTKARAADDIAGLRSDAQDSWLAVRRVTKARDR